MLLTAALSAIAVAGFAKADFCSKGSEEIGGNYYCQPVKHIQYTGVGHEGTYDLVTSMGTDGKCTSKPVKFGGPLAPLDQDLSIHARGPMDLSRVAVYHPSSKTKRSEHNHRRHQHKRAVGDKVVATINGEVVTWANNWDGNAAATPEPEVSVKSDEAKPEAKPTPKKPSDNKPKEASPSTGGAWSRTAYFNREAGAAEGLVFMNNKGGQGSGAFDYIFGNSLSYAAASTDNGAVDSQVLTRKLGSNEEIVIFSDRKCDEGCGYVREGVPSYYGFEGNAKIFVFEFDMPDDGKSGWNMNMPSLWMLNGRIPRTGQYVKSECSCWTSGCGELDLIEVLDSGNKRAKSTIHTQNGAGCSDYFERPTDGKMILVAVLKDNQIDLKRIDSFDFEGGIDEATVSSWTKTDDETSVFNL